MAVTVTKAAPNAAIDKLFVGKQGVHGSDVYAIADDAFAGKRVRVSQLTLSGTYATGGFALTPSDYGLTQIDGIAVIASSSLHSAGAAVPALTTAGQSPVVKLFTDNTGTELTNATSVTNHRFTVLIVGV